ncbi:siderophore-interacting protein [Gordonia liuliyuniae]|uniref:Siderophore-interacting protein n=1 Tax=Gordonia liuliyuniae TaxID=2911517 RepID=A0ABS9IV75_9ACTN|nr:siderophore-interacting protein [Gordonia liuliyuniae]MCF8589405.1 siderophore-interacting protein [Gordonia liuliyuniae]
MTHRRIVPLPLTLRRLTVSSTERITPRMQRVRLGGPELGEFERDGLTLPALVCPGFDDHVKLIFASSGDVADVLPKQVEQGIEWRASDALETRDYTPVRLDVHGRELVLDFVVHTAGTGQESGPAAGIGEAWACAARPGDELWIVGPKSSTEKPDDVDWILLAGDETAQPAVERFLAERPVDVPARIVLAICDESARRDFDLGPDDEITWVLAAADDRETLAAAVADVAPLAGRPYVWAAAESRALLPIRKFASRRLGAAKSHTDITGYWHLTDVEQQAASDDQPQNAPTLPLVTSPVTWFAVRAALRSGLLEVVDIDHPLRLSLVEEAPLVDVLLACDVLVDRDGALWLTDTGEMLLVDEHVAEDFDGVAADQVLALVDLADALDTGRPAWQVRTGQTFAEAAVAHDDVRDELVDRSAGRVYLLPAITTLPVFSRERIGFCGPGAGVVAEGVGRTVEPLSGTYDAVVGADALASRTDHEVVAFLRDLRGATDEAVLIESTSPDGLGGDPTEHALVHLATVGCAPRDGSRVADLAAAADWVVTDTVSVGWGTTATTLRRDPKVS